MSIDNPKIISLEQWFNNNYPNQGECQECNEEGLIDCDMCDGDGKVECYDCESFKNLSGEYEVRCDACKDGYVKCQECDGEGLVDCEECSGTKIDNYYYIELEYTGRLATDLKRYKESMKCTK